MKHMSHEYNLPFEMFEKYNLALMIIKKQRELIESGPDEVKENAIQLMIDKLLLNGDGIEEMILKPFVK